MPVPPSRPQVVIDPDKLNAEICRLSFWEFVQEFWECVPGAGKMVTNWHLEFFCEELQKIATRIVAGLPREYDLVVNCPPGTSKSTIWSILFPAWLWTIMPHARIMSASHTESLVIDLSNKSRAVITGEKYRKLFPEIKLRDDQSAKGYFINTKGGDRYTCTVAGKSPMGFHCHVALIDDPLDPKKVLSEMELKTAEEFISDVIPTRKVDKAVSVLCLVMQRLGLGDSTDVMVKNSKLPGATKLRHIVLPAELSDHVKPAEVKNRYVDGFLDPNRLGESALAQYRGRPYFFSTQFQQYPYSRRGGMFEEAWFNNRVKVAPYELRRVRYWDRGATEMDGCPTAGTLMGIEKDNRVFVENCEHGQWNPDKRNDRIVAVAHRDRARYGPNHEPVIVIEMERGSTGLESFQNLARRLIGFRIVEDRPTGPKDVRAEPWADQCAALNVTLVDDGAWDVDGFVQEHVFFKPDLSVKRLGKLKDRVDSASGGYSWLAKHKPAGQVGIKVLGPRNFKAKGVHLVPCSREELAFLTIHDHHAILISFHDPSEISPEKPAHGLEKLLDWLPLSFVPIEPKDYQERWNQNLEPWGRTPAKLAFGREHAKKLWAFVLKKRPQPADAWVICDASDGTVALSVAQGLCDALGLKRQETISFPGGPDDSRSVGSIHNQHVFDSVKAGRHLVAS